MMAQNFLLRPVGLTLVRRQQYAYRSSSTVLDTPIDPTTQQSTPHTRIASVFEDALNASGPRTSWTKEEISELYNTSLIDLTYAAVCNPLCIQTIKVH